MVDAPAAADSRSSGGGTFDLADTSSRNFRELCKDAEDRYASVISLAVPIALTRPCSSQTAFSQRATTSETEWETKRNVPVRRNDRIYAIHFCTKKASPTARASS